MPALGGEIFTADRSRTEKCYVHDTEKYREQSWQHIWMERAAHERWIPVI